MQKLIAKTPILFETKIYEIGSELPTKNPQMVESWLEAGTAVWINDEVPTKSSVKAIPVTAESGLTGQALVSESEAGEDLVGKIPKTTARTKKTTARTTKK